MFNPKGVFFWLFLAGAATCGAVASGPAWGAIYFLVLAMGVEKLG